VILNPKPPAIVMIRFSPERPVSIRTLEHMSSMHFVYKHAVAALFIS